jgi:metal-sulfur cluster biosynthetic enzyme
VYRIEVEGRRARIALTMTSSTCPLADYLKDLVRSAIRQYVPDVVDVDISLEWEPPWAPDMMSDEPRQLGARALMRLAARRFRCCSSAAVDGVRDVARPGAVWWFLLPSQDVVIAHGPLMVCGFLACISLERAVSRFPMGLCRAGAHRGGRSLLLLDPVGPVRLPINRQPRRGRDLRGRVSAARSPSRR